MSGSQSSQILCGTWGKRKWQGSSKHYFCFDTHLTSCCPCQSSLPPLLPMPQVLWDISFWDWLTNYWNGNLLHASLVVRLHRIQLPPGTPKAVRIYLFNCHRPPLLWAGRMEGSWPASGLLVTINHAQGPLAVDIGWHRRRVKEEGRKEKVQRGAKR